MGLPHPPKEPPRGATLGSSRAATVLGRRGLFAGANGEELKAVSGMVQRHVLSSPSLCDRFCQTRGYSALWRLVLRIALIPGHIKTTLYRLHNPTSAR